MQNARISISRLVAGVFFLLASHTILAGPGIWTSNGPDGGAVYRVVADPLTPGTYYAGTNDGVFRTSDGGSNWFRASAGLPSGAITILAHHPTAGNTLYAAVNTTIYRTTDGGTHWLPQATLTTSSTGIIGLAISPLSADNMWVWSFGGQAFFSSDGGFSWTEVAIGTSQDKVSALAINPANNNVLWAATTDDLASPPVYKMFKSTDGGTTWADVSAVLAPCCVQRVTDIAISSDGNFIYLTNSNDYLGTSGSQAKSTDGGATWSNIGSFPARFVTVNPIDPNEVYLSGRQGLVHSTDGGATWAILRNEFPGNSMGPDYANRLIFDPYNPGVRIAGSDGNGVYIKTPAFTSFLPSSNGLNAHRVRALAIHPTNNNYLLAGNGSFYPPAQLVFSSSSGGNFWAPSSNGLEAQGLRSLVFDPNTAGTPATTTVYATGFAPQYGYTDYLGNLLAGNGGIYKSTNGGINWATIDNGIPSGPYGSYFSVVRDLVLDPSSGLGGSGPLQTLFVAGSGSFAESGGSITKLAARIYRSLDAGMTWTAADNGMVEAEMLDGRLVWPRAVQLEIDPINPSTLYAATFIAYSGPTLPTLENGVWKSTDGGNNWTLYSNGLPRVGGAGTSHYDVLSLAIDPTSPATLYASAHNPVDFSSTVYKTTNGGLNWFPSNTGITSTDVRDLLVDSDGVVYAAAAGTPGNPGGVYRSLDGGASWHSVSAGLEGGAMTFKLAIDESGPSKILYAGTDRSVQSFEFVPDSDLDGVPDSTENSAPNGGDANADGIPDATQSQVASVSTNALGTFAGESPTGQSIDITLEVTPVIGACRLENVEPLNNQSVPAPAEWSFPHGVIRFEMADCQQAQVKIIHHNATGFPSGWGMRVYAPTVPGQDQFVWSDYPAAQSSGNTWQMTLSDGQFGDIRPANGRIRFQGGAGFADLIFKNGF